MLPHEFNIFWWDTKLMVWNVCVQWLCQLRGRLFGYPHSFLIFPLGLFLNKPLKGNHGTKKSGLASNACNLMIENIMEGFYTGPQENSRSREFFRRGAVKGLNLIEVIICISMSIPPSEILRDSGQLSFGTEGLNFVGLRPGRSLLRRWGSRGCCRTWRSAARGVEMTKYRSF